MCNLLERPVIASQTARRTDSGIEVLEPYGGLCVEPIMLASGWYQLKLAGQGNAVCVQLDDIERHRIIELSATDSDPAFVFLTASCYQLTIFAGVRPGRYNISELRIERLSSRKRLSLLLTRFFAEVRAGTSLFTLLKAGFPILFPRQSIGIRSDKVHSKDRLGPLNRADIPLAISSRSPASWTRILVRYKNGLITTEGHGLASQSHQKFTTDPTKAHDAVVIIGENEILYPDALSLFATMFDRSSHIHIVIADIKADGIPTLRAAFDPVLYHGGRYPTPYGVRADHRAKPASWRQQFANFAVISAPVAYTDTTYSETYVSIPEPDEHPFVSIIIPTRDRADLLRGCLEGLFDKTHWPHEVIIVDNGSAEAETFLMFQEFEAKGAKVISADIPFNFSTLCNLGAAAARGKYLVFMNNDIKTIGSDWLSHMMRFAMLPDVGAVGGRLFYADKRLQHGGVALGLTELCGHPWRGLDFQTQETIPQLHRSSLRLAVTGALLCVDRAKFEAVEGFNEVFYKVTLNDIDLCLKLYQQGWFTVYAAGAEAWHAEGESRGSDEDPTKQARRRFELDMFYSQWRDFIDRDPWLPRAMKRSTEAFSFR